MRAIVAAFTVLLVAASLALVSGCAGPGTDASTDASTGALTGAPATPPNVVLVVTDDQGYGEVGRMGHPWIDTPALDALFEDGLWLSHFRTASPVCSPTRASLLSGEDPNRTGTFAWGHPLRDPALTLPGALARAGYATGHFGKWHLGSVRAGDATSPGALGFDSWASSPNFFDRDPYLSVNGVVERAVGGGTDAVTDRAIEHMRAARSQGRPFFTVVWYGDPHVPHVAAEDDLARVRDEVPDAARAYCAELLGIDRGVERLRGALEELGVAHDTILWFTSDNGPRAPGPAAAFATAGLRGDKGTLWEGGVRVPSLVVWPRSIEGGRVSDVAASSCDLLPTLLALLGIDAGTRSSRPDGVDLSGELLGAPRGPDLARRTQGFWMPPVRGRVQHADAILAAMAAGEVHPEEPLPQVDPTLFEAEHLEGRAAWIEGTLKLQRFGAGGDWRYELHDLWSDPDESLDLAAERPELVARLAADLDAWMRDVARDAADDLRR